MKIRFRARFLALAAIVATAALYPGGLIAAVPIANTVPFVASNPTSPHTSWAGNPVILKGTLTSAAFGTDTFTYDWDPGDGGAHCTGTVTNQFNVSCTHTYGGTVGNVYTAILTITDTTTGGVSPASNCPPSITQGACYYTSINAPPPNLPVEVNNAIDNGLWYLHIHMNHTTSAHGAPIGDWTGGIAANADTNGAGDSGPNGLDCTAFEDSGFLTSNVPQIRIRLTWGCVSTAFSTL